MTNFQWIPAVHRLYAVVLLLRSCSSAQYHYIHLCQIHNSDLICKMEKTENTHQVFYQNFEKWTKSVRGSIICETSSIQKSNPRELQYMSILLALAHHQPLNSFFWLNMVGKKICVQFWFSAQTGYWLELEASDLVKPNLTHRKYSLVNV